MLGAERASVGGIMPVWLFVLCLSLWTLRAFNSTSDGNPAEKVTFREARFARVERDRIERRSAAGAKIRSPRTRGSRWI
jgi:hypothetical protein